MSIVCNQCKTVIFGNAVSNFCRYDSGFRTNFDVVSTIIGVKLNAYATSITAVTDTDDIDDDDDHDK